MLNGLVVVDKPKKIKSCEAVALVKGILGVKKAGHSGTLDPNATGILLIAINEATKLMPLLSRLNKKYVGTIKLHSDVDKDNILIARKKFIGEIIQTPPKKSAVRRVERRRKIYSFDITSINGRDIKFEIECEAGTYMRKLAYDFGQILGCGAHLSELRRTEIGPFSANDAINIENLSSKYVLTIEASLERLGIKKVHVKVGFIDKVNNGMPLIMRNLEKYDSDITENELIGIYYKERALALGRALQNFEDITNDKILIKTERVFKIDR